VVLEESVPRSSARKVSLPVTVAPIEGPGPLRPLPKVAPLAPPAMPAGRATGEGRSPAVTGTTEATRQTGT